MKFLTGLSIFVAVNLRSHRCFFVQKAVAFQAIKYTLHLLQRASVLFETHYLGR